MGVFRMGALVSLSLSIWAAEAATITPAPGHEVTRPTSPGMTMPPRPSVSMRGPASFEVETVLITTGDVASLSRWAELAALGYHVVGTVPVGQGVMLCLERSRMGSLQTPRLPASIEALPAVAEELRKRIEASLLDRDQSAGGPVPISPAAPQK